MTLQDVHPDGSQDGKPATATGQKARRWPETDSQYQVSVSLCTSERGPAKVPLLKVRVRGEPSEWIIPLLGVEKGLAGGKFLLLLATWEPTYLWLAALRRLSLTWRLPYLCFVGFVQSSQWLTGIGKGRV